MIRTFWAQQPAQLYLPVKNAACSQEQERLEHIRAAFVLPLAAYLPD
jgi:hypothetical protein